MRTTLPLALALLLPVCAGAAVVGSVFGGRVPCAERDGVQFCEGDLATRVESFDGVPLDVNLTLPPAALPGPFPLVVELHGWSLAKTPGPSPRAARGYAVLSYTARGFHASCGFPASRAPDPSLADPDACARRGWTHLADARYEARDTQHLAGLLADAGLVLPDRIGVTGVSYGGGQSMILAALRDRLMLPDGSLVPWTSSGGLPMRIAAAAPLIPWSDLADALTPTGRTLDYRMDNSYGRRGGVQKQSWVNVLYTAGAGTGFYVPDGSDPAADLTGWNARIAAGEPYDGDPAAQSIVDEITAYHSAYYVDDAVPPAPLLMYSAWTDDLFPGDQIVRFWRKTRARHPGAEIAMLLADGFGHPRAGLGGDAVRVSRAVEAFFDRHLLGTGDPPPAVQAWTQACNGAAEEGPFAAGDWDALHPGEVRARFDEVQRFDQAGGDPAVSRATDPLNGGPCRTVPAVDDPAAATYRLPAATGAGYTLLGAPTVIADLLVSGSYAQVAARLWDVAPDGTQTLVSHVLHRPRSDNPGVQPFQLHPNGWRFAAGHAPKLELLGQDPPYGREAGGPFTVTVRSLELRLPVREAPDGTVVTVPAAPVLPPAVPEPPDSGPPACPPAPAAGCAAGGGSLFVKDAAQAAKDRLAWTWKGGASAAFGDPAGTTAFRLCVYGADSALLAGVAVQAGGECARGRKTAPCWRRVRGGWRYDDARAAGGLASLALARTRAGRTAIALRAKGAALALAAAAPSPPVRVQLLGNRDACWEARFTTRPRRTGPASRFSAAVLAKPIARSNR